MTVRTRRPEGGIRTRLGRMVETEDRQQTLVTILFILAIGAVILILLGAIALGWYNDNLRPLGNVGSTEISPQMMRDRIGLEQWRISRDESRITQAQISGELDADTAQQKLADLDQRTSDLSTTALDTLADEIYQSQLAAEQGITASAGDIDARLAQELSSEEQRHVLSIVVEPQAADETGGPTFTEQHAALDNAQKALDAVNSGADWSTVAKQYGTDDASKNGGDLGNVTKFALDDESFADQIFRLQQGGTTGILRDGNGAYRIGRVTEITPGSEDPSLRTSLFKNSSEESIRNLLGFEVAAGMLQDKVVADALAATPEQVRAAVIYIDGLPTGDANEADGEIDYSEIVYAPNDNLDVAPDLPAEDAAWTKAKEDADAAFAELQAITDVEQRKTRFGEIATANSDSPTKDSEGSVGFVTRDIPPQAVSDALWGGTFQDGDLIGPVRGDAGYYVLMFHERRASPDDRLKAVQDALAAPGADFNQVAGELSEGPEKADGGEIGWLTKDQLSSDIADQIWNLAVGTYSDPIEIGNGRYIIKVEEKTNRPLDVDQQANIRQTAFSDWYTPKRDDAQTNGIIVIAGSDTTNLGTDVTGGDQMNP
jgi:parvulin-like peptidyl-prolyl isomerase